MNHKTALLFVMALALSLGSCVNESKNTPQSIPLDTNYLHSFSKVSIGVYGVYDKTRKLDGGPTFVIRDSGGILALGDGYSDPINIIWAGSSFSADSSKKSHTDPIFPLTGRSDESEIYSLRGRISEENMVEAIFKYSYLIYSSDRRGTPMVDEDKGFNINFVSIPVITNKPDALTFYYDGPTLKNHILALQSTLSKRYTYYRQQPENDTLKNIIWDAPLAPTLTITFYK